MLNVVGCTSIPSSARISFAEAPGPRMHRLRFSVFRGPWVCRSTQGSNHRVLGPSPQRGAPIWPWMWPNMGPLFGSPYNKSPAILGSILGPPIVGNSHIPLKKTL